MASFPDVMEWDWPLEKMGKLSIDGSDLNVVSLLNKPIDIKVDNRVIVVYRVRSAFILKIDEIKYVRITAVRQKDRIESVEEVH